MTRVSVITVVLDGVRTIEQTIQSVLKQTHTDVEYIVIDGGSTDGTLDIIERYSDRLSYWVSEPDSGIYNAMNKGISKAHGDVIGIINSDDWYEYDAVKTVVKGFENHPDLGVVFGDVFLVNDKEQDKQIRNLSPLRALWHDMSVNHPATFVRKEVYSELGCFDERFRISADYEIVNRFWNNGVRFGYIKKPLAYYRVNGMSAVQRDKREEENSLIIEKYFDYSLFKELFLERAPYGFDRLYVWGTGHGGIVLSDILEKCGIEIEAYVENDLEKAKKTFRGRTVIIPEAIMTDKTCIVISAYSFEKQIRKQIIEEIGFPETSIICYTECFDEYEKALELKNGSCVVI